MCGIAGLVSLAGSLDDGAVQQVRRLCGALAHRGPDGEGIVVRSQAVLGHRRLAVMDLTDAGSQPMGSGDGKVWVVFNGEIYNHRDIRAELEALGYQFRSQCDTEVLVHGYREWGMRDLLPRLRGMFAIGLWDEHARRLWLVRDRLGVKPLFYAVSNSTVVFASEIRPLFDVHRPTADAIDPVALDCFLAFGNLPPDRAILRGIEKLPPGTAIEFDESGHKVWRYWSVPLDRDASLTGAGLMPRVESALHEAVAARLESDVPLGCFLSGGIDSGLVASLAAGDLAGPLTTLSAGFDGMPGGDSELPLARLVADRYETAHEEIHLTGQSLATLPRLLWMAGEPFADSSLVPTAAVCQAARQRVTVALTGDGGDEIFGGYYRVLASYWGSRARDMLGTSGSKLAGRFMQALPDWRPFQRAATVLAYGTMPLVELYAERTAVFDSPARMSLYRPEWLERRGAVTARDVIAQRADRYQLLTLAEAQAAMDIEFQLPGRYLSKVDIASSTFALECRSPFVDHYLVELMSQVPLGTLLQHGRQKGLLRSIAARYLPRRVVRAPKRGFGPRTGTWLGTKEARILDSLRPFAIGQEGGPLAEAQVERVLREHLAGHPNRGKQVWSLLCLELWWRMFVTGTMNPEEELANA